MPRQLRRLVLALVAVVFLASAFAGLAPRTASAQGYSPSSGYCTYHYPAG